MKFTHVLTAAAAALLLTACGGGGDSAADEVATPQAGNEVPESAMASASSYAMYAGSLALSDTAAPMEVNKVVAPTSETDAPIPVL